MRVPTKRQIKPVCVSTCIVVMRKGINNAYPKYINTHIPKLYGNPVLG